MTKDKKPRVHEAQPLHALQISDALLRIKTVEALTGLGKTSLHARIKSGELNSIRLGKRCTRFRASEVQRFLRALGNEVVL